MRPLLTVGGDLTAGDAQERGRRLADALLGAGEAPLALGTGMAGQTLRGLHGLLGLTTGGFKGAADAYNRPGYEFEGYRPRSELLGGYLGGVGKGLQQAAHGASEYLQDKGALGPVGAAMLATGLEAGPQLLDLPGLKRTGFVDKVAAAGRLKELKAGIKGNRYILPWTEMNLNEARAAAVKQLHLVPDGQGGFRGAPAGMTKGGLRRMRDRLDAAIDNGVGVGGERWYPEGREAIRQSVATPEEGTKQGGVLGAYSPNKSVEQSVNITNEHRVGNAVLGPEEALAQQMGNKNEAAKASSILKGEPVEMGPKEGPFGRALDPAPAEVDSRVPVNDTHMAQLMGYEMRSAKGTTKGLSTGQHNFMTGEMHLAHQRAIERGILPPESTVHEAQAAAWVGKRMAVDGMLPEEAMSSFKDLFRKYQGNETFELVPGAPGHMEGATDLPLADRERLSRALDWGKRDPLYEALGIPQGDVTEGLGQFKTKRKERLLSSALKDEAGNVHTGGVLHGEVARDLPLERARALDAAPDVAYSPSEAKGNVGDWTMGFVDNSTGEFIGRKEAARRANVGTMDPEGRLMSEDILAKPPTFEREVTEYNPNRTAHPFLAFEGSRPALTPSSQSALEQVGHFRAAMDAQKAYAYNAPRIKHGTNAAVVSYPEQLSPEATRGLYDKAAAGGLNLIDNGGGKFTLAGDYGSMGGKEFGRKLRALELPEGAQVERAGLDPKRGTSAPDLRWGPEGSGQITSDLLEHVSPRVGEQLHTERVSRALERKNAAEGAFATESMRPRADVQRLRSMVAEQGLEGVRARVTDVARRQGLSLEKAAAILGLPALGLVVTDPAATP